MVTKAIIKNINWTTSSNGTQQAYSVELSIPFLNTVQDGIICTLPKCNFYPTIGDIVFVTFENYDINKPIIIGCLFKETGNTSSTSIETESLIVNGLCELSKDTTIGDVTYNELKYLEGLQQNLQQSLNNIEDRLKALEDNN